MRIKFFQNLFTVILGVLLAITLTITVFAEPGPQGTEGDELQVAETQQLEIQLGPEWTGVEFMLRTDAGLYPDRIPVDGNGILRLEIGGSKQYTLSCIDSSVAAPNLFTQASVTTEETVPLQNTGNENETSVSGIPLPHIIMFAVGIVLAIGILVVLYIAEKNKQVVQNDEDEEDF